MELRILDINGNSTTKKVEFDENIFFKESYDRSIYLEIKRFLSVQRQGAHKSKERGELSGGTRKLPRQKGTGGSRKVNIKNPIFRNGERVFGPKSRKYLTQLNKGTKSTVRKFIIEQKLIQNKIKIVENIELNIPKTKFILEIKKSLKLMDKKLLMVLGEENQNLYLSSRNLENF